VRRPLLIGGNIGVVLLALGCGDTGGLLLVDKPVNPSEVLLPGELCSDTAIATFEDGNLLAAVRSSLGLASLVDLTCNRLPGVTALNASAAGIVSLVGMQNLTALISRQLDNNAITILGSLGGLTALASLTLDDNNDLINIQALLDNTGLAAGDNVGLTNTAVECIDVAALQAKGVTVSSDCELGSKGV
jgi:Leucine-rich repeat (LRR) protein